MYLSQKELCAMMDLVSFTLQHNTTLGSRQLLLDKLMEMFRADYGASCCWNPNEKYYQEGVFSNMSLDNISKYNDYYQFHDPITNKLRQFRRAVAVSEIIPRDQFIQTEFYNDFLQRDGLSFGVNLHIYCGQEHIFDVRLWRSQQQGDFDAKHLNQLDLLLPYLRAMGEREPLKESLSFNLFTQRELEVISQIKSGMNDKNMARTMNVSVTTLRSHIRSIYKKADVHSRTELISKLAPN